MIVSSGFVVDVGDDELAPDGFDRRDSWRPGRYVLRSKILEVEGESPERLSDLLSSVLQEQFAFFDANQHAQEYRRAGMGRLQMRISLPPYQTAIRLPAEFLVKWGSLGGDVSIDIPLNR